jgi:hypothetical protein
MAMGAMTICAVMMHAAMNKVSTPLFLCASFSPSSVEQREHRRIGEMKERDRGRENQQRLGFKDDPQAARLAVAVLIGATCEVMIDPTRLDREHGENARGSQRRNEARERHGAPEATRPPRLRSR